MQIEDVQCSIASMINGFETAYKVVLHMCSPYGHGRSHKSLLPVLEPDKTIKNCHWLPPKQHDQGWKVWLNFTSELLQFNLTPVSADTSSNLESPINLVLPRGVEVKTKPLICCWDICWWRGLRGILAARGSEKRRTEHVERTINTDLYVRNIQLKQLNLNWMTCCKHVLKLVR